MKSKGKPGYTLEVNQCDVVETFGLWIDCWDYWFFDLGHPEGYHIRCDKTQYKTPLDYTDEEIEKYKKNHLGY